MYKILWKNEIAGASLDRKRIAVLPFMNISPDPSDEYFADGLTEELIDRLCQIRELQVIARTSVMSFKKKEKKAAEIGRELRAGALVEGSVRKAGNKIRVTAQLIDANSEGHLWSSSYDRNLEDIFEVQSDIAENVADALKTKLLDEDKEKITKKPTGDINAYTLYLKGRYYWNERNKESVEKAIKYFEEALKRDPKYALAYSGIADSYIVLVGHGHLAPSVGYAKAKSAAMKAIELDDRLAEAHTSLASILSAEWDWTGAEEEFAKALRINPNYATAHHWNSLHLLDLGRLDEAFREIKVAEELDPLSPIMHTALGVLYFYARQYDVALEEHGRALELDPNFWPAHTNRIDVYLLKSMFNEATEELKWYLPGLPSTTAALSEAQFRSYVNAASGRTQEAIRIILECEDKIAHERDEDIDQYVMVSFASIYAKVGNKDHALEWLRRCFEVHAITPFKVRILPYFDEITSDPRFDELVKKTGVAELLPGRDLQEK